MKKQVLFLVLMLPLLLWQCNEDGEITPGPDDNSPTVERALDCDETPTACDLTKTINDFGFEIFEKLDEEDPDDNIFISPLSITTALSMALNGAEGATLDEMRQTLNVTGMTVEEMNKAYQVLIETFPNLDETIDLNIANSIWYDENFTPHTSFLDINAEFYSSEVEDLDFKNPASVDVINGWVDNKTNGLIDEIINEISPDAVMFLINAIYFKANWLNSFDPTKTESRPFNLADGSTTNVDMMFYEELYASLPYYANAQFGALDMAYGEDSTMSMTVILPHPGVDIHEVISSLDDAMWDEIDANLFKQKVLFGFPKFKLEYEKTLNKTLESMGMQVPFTSFADFSNIADANLYISFVKHKSFIEVDEVGTEAAAVTIIGVETTSLGPDFYVNRPFLFFIREKANNSIIFSGKVMNPNS